MKLLSIYKSDLVNKMTKQCWKCKGENPDYADRRLWCNVNIVNASKKDEAHPAFQVELNEAQDPVKTSVQTKIIRLCQSQMILSFGQRLGKRSILIEICLLRLPFLVLGLSYSNYY